jgi:hypothetical protein
MGGTCSKNKTDFCLNKNEENGMIKCVCPNGLPVPGLCEKDNNIACLKCSSGYGNKDISPFSYNIKKDVLGKPSANNEIIINKDKKGDYIYLPNGETSINLSNSFTFNTIKNKIDNKYYLYPNKPLNNKCSSVLKFKDKIGKLKNIEPKCEDLLAIGNNKLLFTDVIKAQESWKKLKGSFTTAQNADVNNINNYITESNNLLSYSECVTDESKANKKSLGSIIKTLAKNESMEYKNKKTTLAKNRRLVKFNLDNQTWYNNYFTLVKHLIYFGLLIFLLIILKPNLLPTIFYIFIILLITSTVIVISNDLIEIFKF